MIYVSVGAVAPGNKTKAAFKRAVAAGEAEVYPASPLGPVFDGMVVDLPEDITLSVVGPNPWTDRRWYASVTRRNGKLVVK